MTLIQELKFQDSNTFDSLTKGHKFHTNDSRTKFKSIGDRHWFVIYKNLENGFKKYLCVEGIKVSGSSDYEEKNPWVITQVYNSGVTDSQLSHYQKTRIDLFTLF